MIGREALRWFPRRNRLSRFVFGASILLALCSMHAKPSRSNVDHLVPVGQMVYVPYQLLLARNLYLTPANYVRVVFVPSSGAGPETAISLYSNLENTEEAILTWTQGDREVWAAASDLDPTLSRDPKVKINRVDLPFPKMLAISLSKAIQAMIEHSREATSSDRVTLHGTHILFMIDDFKGRTIQARLSPESRGRRTSALRKVTQVLMAYCKSKPEERPKLRKKIQGEVRRLSRR